MGTPAQDAISREKRGWLAEGRGRRYHATRAVPSDVRRLWFHRVPFTSASRQPYKTHLNGSSDRSCGQRADRRGSSAVQEIVGAKRPCLRLETPRSVSQAHTAAAVEGVPEAIQGTQGNPASSDGWRTTGCVCGRDSQGVLEEDRETMRLLFCGWECAGGRVARPAKAWGATNRGRCRVRRRLVRSVSMAKGAAIGARTGPARCVATPQCADSNPPGEGPATPFGAWHPPRGLRRKSAR